MCALAGGSCNRDNSCSPRSVLCGLLFVERWAAAAGVDPWGLRDLEGLLSAEVVGTRGGGAVGGVGVRGPEYPDAAPGVDALSISSNGEGFPKLLVELY